MPSSGGQRCAKPVSSRWVGADEVVEFRSMGTRINADERGFYGFVQDSVPLLALSKALRLNCGLGPKLRTRPTSYGVALR